MLNYSFIHSFTSLVYLIYKLCFFLPLCLRMPQAGSAAVNNISASRVKITYIYIEFLTFLGWNYHLWESAGATTLNNLSSLPMPTFIYHTFLYSPALWVSRAHSKGLWFTRRWIYQNNGTHPRRICAVWIKASTKHHSERYKCFCKRVRRASRNADWESIRQHYQLTVCQYQAEHDVSL